MVGFIRGNTHKVGLVVSIVVPVIIFIASVIIMSGSIALWSDLKVFFILKALSKILSLCVYPNLIIFYLYLHFNKEHSAKGVVLGTLIMALVVLLLFLAQKMY